MVTDGSSFVDNGIRRAGYVTVSLHQIIEAKLLPLTPQLKKLNLRLSLELSKWAKTKRLTFILTLNMSFWFYMPMWPSGDKEDFYMQNKNKNKKLSYKTWP